jgi:hypothetical protein
MSKAAAMELPSSCTLVSAFRPALQVTRFSGAIRRDRHDPADGLGLGAIFRIIVGSTQPVQTARDSPDR